MFAESDGILPALARAEPAPLSEPESLALLLLRAGVTCELLLVGRPQPLVVSIQSDTPDRGRPLLAEVAANAGLRGLGALGIGHRVDLRLGSGWGPDQARRV